MRRVMMAAPAILALAGCQKPIAINDSELRNHGRFAGIGVFDAGPMWASIAGLKAPANAATATTADDQHIIVVVDAVTGEVRECGDLSGVCAAMNPWTAAISDAQRLPARVTEHLSELNAKDQQAMAAITANKADADTNGSQ